MVEKHLIMINRFMLPTINNGFRAGCVEIRVYNSSGGINFIRIANEGIDIHSETKINIFSGSDMAIQCMGRLSLDGENVLINSRRVRKEAGLGSI